MKAFTLTVLAAMFLTPVHAIPLKPVTTLQPTYPVQAAAKRIEGQVTATFDILDDGRVDNVSLTGCHLFFRETLTAMRHWLYPAGGTVAKLAMRQPFVLFKGLTFQKLCLPG
ncbi:TonB family protein, partial [Klebsiella pneumoniae]|uniref:TonB family protein n=1 Tax=Klebsiella pneumoniae TaxID=573 RepID=UPI001D0E9F51